VCLPLSEELASTSGSEESEVEEERRHRSSKQAPVVVFDGGTATRTPMTAKRDRRNFLVSMSFIGRSLSAETCAAAYQHGDVISWHLHKDSLQKSRTK
jgi:hypothetical protein